MQLPQPSSTVRHVLEAIVVLAAIVLAILSLRTPTPPRLSPADSLAVEDVTPEQRGKQVLVVSGGALTSGAVQKAAVSIDWEAEFAAHEGAGISRAPTAEKPLAVAVRTDAAD